MGMQVRVIPVVKGGAEDKIAAMQEAGIRGFTISGKLGTTLG